MNPLQMMFEFGTEIKYNNKKYFGISSVGYNTKEKLSFWLAVKQGDSFPCKVYLIPKKIEEYKSNDEVKEI